MTTYAANWDDAIAARPTRSVLGRVAIALSSAWTRRKTHMILADLDDHTLADIGLEPAAVRSGRQMAGWLVKAQARMPGVVFLGH